LSADLLCYCLSAICMYVGLLNACPSLCLRLRVCMPVYLPICCVPVCHEASSSAGLLYTCLFVILLIGCVPTYFCAYWPAVRRLYFCRSALCLPV
jgi:hypothetical protein